MYISIGCGFVCLSLAALTACAAPADSDITASRKEFLALRRPLAYASIADTEDRNIPLYWLELHGQSRFFFTKWGTETLVYALWDFLDDSTYSADSTIMLLGGIGKQHVGTWQLSYKSPSEQGNWPAMAAELVRQCKRDSRSALGQPEWWYPHPALFDRARVLSESKTNAALRAAHIGAMVEALAGPGIRAGNPLEVRSALMILDALKAHEAVQTFVDYMFYDWRTASDYRLGEGDLIPPSKYDPYKPNNLSQVQLPAFMYLPRLGDIGVPLALRRLSDATAEERSTEVGGGATPIIAIQYFRWLLYTEQQALKAVTDYQGGAELSQSQKEALAEIIEVIVKKKHRTDALLNNRHPAVRTWAPSFTNHPYGAQP